MARFSAVEADRAGEKPADGAVRTAVSEGLVALLKEFYGVGPSQARTYTFDDLVVCVLRGGHTRVEQTLLEGGRGSAVIRQRMAFQEVMRQRFVDVVEEATGRQVVGYMSGSQQEPDMLCETFVLAPTDFVKEDELDRRSDDRPWVGGIPSTTEELDMGDGTADDLKGRAKEAAGDLTDDKSLKNEGKVDRASGSIKDKVGDAGDKLKDATRRD